MKEVLLISPTEDRVARYVSRGSPFQLDGSPEVSGKLFSAEGRFVSGVRAKTLGRVPSHFSWIGGPEVSDQMFRQSHRPHFITGAPQPKES